MGRRRSHRGDPAVGRRFPLLGCLPLTVFTIVGLAGEASCIPVLAATEALELASNGVDGRQPIALVV